MFTELEFKTLGKRILGETFNAFQSAPQGVQTDLFGNEVEQKLVVNKIAEEVDNTPAYGLVADKNIDNTPHEYHLVETKEEIQQLVKELLAIKEICFDTETTGTDANNVEIVGLSFAYENNKAYYTPFSSNQNETRERLKLFVPLFQDANKCWVGQNIKYDLLVLKWYGIEPKGELFDTMLAHYVIEPEGRRSMDLLSAQYLSLIHI